MQQENITVRSSRIGSLGRCVSDMTTTHSNISVHPPSDAITHENVSVKVLEVKTSSFFTAILEYLFDIPVDCRSIEPAFTDMVRCQSSVLAQMEGDIGHNQFIGSYLDLMQNCEGIAKVAGLDEDELQYFLHLLP